MQIKIPAVARFSFVLATEDHFSIVVQVVCFDSGLCQALQFCLYPALGENRGPMTVVGTHYLSVVSCPM
jgi:hypothetical protein